MLCMWVNHLIRVTFAVHHASQGLALKLDCYIVLAVNSRGLEVHDLLCFHRVYRAKQIGTGK